MGESIEVKTLLAFIIVGLAIYAPICIIVGAIKKNKTSIRRGVIALVALVITFILYPSDAAKKVSKDTTEQTKNVSEKPKETSKKPAESTKKVEKPVVSKEKNETKEESKINTSVFRYAKKVDVTDARDITKHITVTVFMDKKLREGLAAQHVLNQTYDFVQQTDIKGADTLTVGVMVGELRVFQYTVDLTKFVPNEAEPMINVVLASSTVEKISPEVEEFAKTFEWKMKK